MRYKNALLKAIAILFGTSIVLSCTKSLIPDNNGAGINMELIASCSDTRTSNEGMSTLWVSGDQISLVHNPAQGGEFQSELFSLKGGATFTGTVSNTQSFNNWYAFYPYLETNVNPSAFSFSVDPCQSQNGNDSKAHISGKGFPLFGMKTNVELSSSLTIPMKNILSVADFLIVNKYGSPVTITSIEFTSTTDIAGPFSGDFTAAQPEYEAQTGAGKTVVLTITNGGIVSPESGAHFYVGLLPHTIPAGSTVSVRITANVDGRDISCPITKTLTAETSFKAGKIKTVNLNFSSQYEWQNATFNLENKRVAQYLDEAEEEYTDENYKTGFLGWGKSVVDEYLTLMSSSNRFDIPAPVKLSWNTSANGSKTVQVFRDALMTASEMQITSSGNSAEIWNLIPGMRYWYKVLAQDGSLLTGGTFSTTGRRRMIKVSDKYNEYHANNFRDLGGIRTVDGKTLKYGKLYRGTNVDEATQAEKDYIREYLNVALDVDLRTYGSSNLGDDIDFVNGQYTGKIEEFYSDKENGQFKKIFAKIVEHLEKDEAVYIHCKSGADRTGYVCILLEAVLGVSPKECSIDYELTSFSISGPHLRNDNIAMPLGRKGMDYISGLDKNSTFQENACTILKKYGVPEEQILAFRREMLE